MVPGAELTKGDVARLVDGGVLDALIRVLHSDVRYADDASRLRRADVVRAAHDALGHAISAARKFAEATADPRGHPLSRWCDSRDFKTAVAVAASPLEERTSALRPRGPAEGDAVRAYAAARALRLLDSFSALARCRDPEYPLPALDAALAGAGQRLLAKVPWLARSSAARARNGEGAFPNCAGCPLGAAFQLLYDLGVAGHVDSTEEERTSNP